MADGQHEMILINQKENERTGEDNAYENFRSTAPSQGADKPPEKKTNGLLWLTLAFVVTTVVFIALFVAVFVKFNTHIDGTEMTSNSLFQQTQDNETKGATVRPVWNPWEEWSNCSKMCGAGELTRTRICNGSGCTGESLEKFMCNTLPCPVWDMWEQWSNCSKTCDTGERRRIRLCNNGPGCTGDWLDTIPCNTQLCPVWAQWEQWSTCSKTCGTGERTKTRICNNGPGCTGERIERELCNTRGCPAWTQWGQWASCSTTCGSGQRTRTRSCNNSPGCVGNSVEMGTCDDRNCPVWAQWGPWSTCTATCGTGSHRRSRSCNYGPGCGGSSADSETCNTQACPICYVTSDGRDYRGYVSHANSGRTCQNWTSQSPHMHSNTPEKVPNAGLGNHNYCRNPDGEPLGPWCYTTDSDSRWEYCPAPKC